MAREGDAEARLEEAEQRRLALEAERRMQIALRAKKAAEEAERAKQARVEAALEADKQNQEMLRLLKIKWAEASKHCDQLRDEKFAKAGAKVSEWKTRRAAALGNVDKYAEEHEKKMAKAWVQKEARIKGWEVRKEEERQRKAAESEAARQQNASRFDDVLEERTSTLNESLAAAEVRRKRMAYEMQVKLERLAELAEQRTEEAWERRVRAEQARETRRLQVEEVVMRKAEQATMCLKLRHDKIEMARRDESRSPRGVGVWRSPGSISPR